MILFMIECNNKISLLIEYLILKFKNTLKYILFFNIIFIDNQIWAQSVSSADFSIVYKEYPQKNKKYLSFEGYEEYFYGNAFPVQLEHNEKSWIFINEECNFQYKITNWNKCIGKVEIRNEKNIRKSVVIGNFVSGKLNGFAVAYSYEADLKIQGRFKNNLLDGYAIWILNPSNQDGIENTSMSLNTSSAFDSGDWRSGRRVGFHLLKEFCNRDYLVVDFKDGGKIPLGESMRNSINPRLESDTDYNAQQKRKYGEGRDSCD
jgi:hypothetical protein